METNAPAVVHYSKLSRSELFAKVKYQYLAVFCVNLITLSHGSSIGWLSPLTLKFLSKENSPLDDPITWSDISWIGSFTYFGALVGTVVFYFILRYLSLRKALLLLPFPTMAAYIVLLVAKNPIHLCIARSLSGCTGGGMFLCLPLYVAELADRRCRGFLGSWMVIVLAIGVLGSFVFGTYLPYWVYPITFIWTPILYLWSMVMLPSSPHHHLIRNDYANAEKSYIFYRLGNKYDSVVDKAKMSDDLRRLWNLLNMRQKTTYNKTVWERIGNRSAACAILITLTIIALNIFSGTIVVLTYTVTIFDKLSPLTIDARTSAVAVAAIQVFSVYLASTVMDKIGRQSLLLISCVGSAIMALALTGFAWVTKTATWHVFYVMPIMCMVTFLFMTSVGIVPISFVSIAEILPHEIREIGSMLAVVALNVFAFVAVKTAPFIMNRFGLDWLFAMFAVVCLLGAVFVYYFVPETKLKNLYTT